MRPPRLAARAGADAWQAAGAAARRQAAHQQGARAHCCPLQYPSPLCTATTDVIRNDNAQATCSRRRLQAFNPPNITPPSQISATLAAWSAEIDAKFGVLEAALKRLVESGKLASKIQESGVCAYAYPRLFGRKG